jgi:hypothetical protein
MASVYDDNLTTKLQVMFMTQLIELFRAQRHSEQSAPPAFQNTSSDKILSPFYVRLILLSVVVYELYFVMAYLVLRLLGVEDYTGYQSYCFQTF